MEWIVKIAKPMTIDTFCPYDDCTVEAVYDTTTAILSGVSEEMVRMKAEKLYKGKVIISVKKYDGGYIREDKPTFYKKK